MRTRFGILLPKSEKIPFLPSSSKNRQRTRLSCPILFVFERCSSETGLNPRRTSLNENGRRKRRSVSNMKNASESDFMIVILDLQVPCMTVDRPHKSDIPGVKGLAVQEIATHPRIASMMTAAIHIPILGDRAVLTEGKAVKPLLAVTRSIAADSVNIRMKLRHAVPEVEAVTDLWIAGSDNGALPETMIITGTLNVRGALPLLLDLRTRLSRTGQVVRRKTGLLGWLL
jgi:hypothetical protein